MILLTASLELHLRTTDDVLAWIDSLDDATRAEVSPEWIARVRTSPAPDPWTHGFVMVHRATGEHVGSCAFKGPPDEERMVEIGYGVDPAHEGKGYATEAAGALVRFALGKSAVFVVRAHTRLDGGRSMRVLEKCGFARVGEVNDPEDGLVVRWERWRELWHRDELEPELTQTMWDASGLAYEALYESPSGGWIRLGFDPPDDPCHLARQRGSAARALLALTTDQRQSVERMRKACIRAVELFRADPTLVDPFMAPYFEFLHDEHESIARRHLRIIRHLIMKGRLDIDEDDVMGYAGIIFLYWGLGPRHVRRLAGVEYEGW